MERAVRRIASRTPDGSKAEAASMSAREISTFSVRPSKRRAYASSARSPSRRTRSTIADTRRSTDALRRSPRSSSASMVFVWRKSMIRIRARSHHDLVQGVFDDPLGACALELRDQVADGALFENRIDGDPVLVAERRDRRTPERRKQREDP